MAKKNFGKFLALAALSGAVAAGVSYFLKYQSFHKELDEDFHDFEGEGEQEEDDSFDGVHLLPDACKVWLDYLKTHTVEG